LRAKNSELTAKSFPFKNFLASVLKGILSLDASSELVINTTIQFIPVWNALARLKYSDIKAGKNKQTDRQ